VTESTNEICDIELHHNGWVSLREVRNPSVGVNGYVYSHETRCQGRIVAILPYRDTAHGREFLVKSEMTPCWGFDQVLSAITGGYEGGDIEDDAVREMLEETGYGITRDELIPLGTCYASKSADTVYSLFSVDLTGREPGEAIGDGSRVEAESAAVWLDLDDLARVQDAQVAVMWLRLANGSPAAESSTGPWRAVVADRYGWIHDDQEEAIREIFADDGDGVISVRCGSALPARAGDEHLPGTCTSSDIFLEIDLDDCDDEAEALEAWKRAQAAADGLNRMAAESSSPVEAANEH
jgi:8-oxo-dGTP pyrophosphatase MutT (NUDIX family)